MGFAAPYGVVIVFWAVLKLMRGDIFLLGLLLSCIVIAFLFFHYKNNNESIYGTSPQALCLRTLEEEYPLLNFKTRSLKKLDKLNEKEFKEEILSVWFSSGIQPVGKSCVVEGTPTWEQLRKIVWERDGFRCRRCGRFLKLHSDSPSEVAMIHHVPHRKYDGSDSPENLVCLCLDCHTTMPEHRWIRANLSFAVSGSGKIHLKGCPYFPDHPLFEQGDFDALIEKGYVPCKVCHPDQRYEEALEGWKPRIIDDVQKIETERLLKRDSVSINDKTCSSQ